MTEQNKLKACPFCGSTPESVPQCASGRRDPDRQIWCAGCSALGPIKESDEDAITAWNTRTGATEQNKAVEAIRAFLPTNLSLDNPNIGDDVRMPLDCTMGELRALAAALSRPTQTAETELKAADVETLVRSAYARGYHDGDAAAAKDIAALSTQPDTRVEPLSNACIRLSDRLNAAGEAKLAHNLMVCGKRLFDKGACDEQD